MREFPIPAVRAIIVNPDNRVLMLRRANSDYGDGWWCLPGGKIDFGQKANEALAHKIKKKTKLQCKSYRFFMYQDNLPYEMSDLHFLSLYFVVKVTGDIKLNEESSSFVWVSSEELDNYKVAFLNDLAIKKYWENGI